MNGPVPPHSSSSTGRVPARPRTLTEFSAAMVLAGVVALLAQACAKIETRRVETSMSPKAANLTPLTMNLLPQLTYAGFMIAAEEGFFEAEGIDAEFVEIENEQILMAAAGGELDVASLFIRPGIFNTMLRTDGLKIVADKGHSSAGDCTAEAFLAAMPTAERIARTGSYRGVRFVRRRARLEEYLIELLLEREKLTADDIEYADISTNEWISALQDRIDVVAYTYEPRVSMLLEKKLARIVLSAEDLDPGHQYSVVMFGPRLLQKEPELGRRFMRAYLRGIRQYNLGKTDRNVQILSKYTRLPPELVRQACWVAIHEDGRVRPEAVQRFLDWSLRKGYVDGAVPVSRWWDGSYIEAAMADISAAGVGR